MIRSAYIVFVLWWVSQACTAQAAGVDLKVKWPAYWINCPNIQPSGYGIYHFRKKIRLENKPGKLVINISADNRYRFFVNGRPVSEGPSRGDLLHWYYETVDIAPYLKKGENIIAALVWNMGEYRPLAQLSARTGLIVQSSAQSDSAFNTGNGWKVLQNEGYAPVTAFNYFVGASDSVNTALYPWGWEYEKFEDAHWKDAVQLGRGTPYGSSTGYTWVLTPRDIPPMEHSLQRVERVRRAVGINVPEGWPSKHGRLFIPANKKITLLLDQDFLTTGYPELLVSGGRNAAIRMRYAEALFKNNQKGNRNETDGYEMINAPADYFLADGGRHRLLRPLWIRTWRYIQMEIETGAEPLQIEDFYGMFTAYPFEEKAAFESDDKILETIWSVGWRTARLCAHETYFDCPYYEQLQYIGDTRIQSLISLYVAGDDRLMKKAIRAFNRSRTYEGITDSRYPGFMPQFIPPFSLYWINMIQDHWMHRGDTGLVKECLPGIVSVLGWFKDKMDAHTGMLGALPHWNFVDWTKSWPWSNELPLGGVPPGGFTGGSAILSLQLAFTLKDAVKLCTTLGDTVLARHYSNWYTSLIAAVKKNCWDDDKGLFADDINKTSYSQHVNIMAILADALPENEQLQLFDRMIKDNALIQPTLYYRFYLFRALKKVGRGNDYLNFLQPWKDMLNIGLTTFAEKPEPTRSDCHAWSASPNYDLLSLVCGIEPLEPGFKTLRIAPQPGNLKFIKAKMPHPSGDILLNLVKTHDGLKGNIILPAELYGEYIYNNKMRRLKPGKNLINDL